MRRVSPRCLTLLVAFCCASPLSASEIVILAGGDRLTGTVVGSENGKLLLRTKYADSPLRIDRSLVVSVTGDSGQSVPEPVKEEPAGAGWLERSWKNSSISADFSQSYSGLSRYNQISSNSEIDYEGDRWDGAFTTHYDYYGATETGASTYQAYGRFTAQRYFGGDHFFLFPYAFLGRQTTADAGRGQVRQYGGGAGWTFRRHESNQVSPMGGMVRSVSSGFTFKPDETRADIRVHDPLFVAAVFWDKTLRHKITTKVLLYYFKPATGGGHHAMATDASAKIPIVGPLYFTMHVYDTPELRQRQLFSIKNLQVSSGFGVEF